MKLLLFSDLHLDVRAAAAIVERAEAADVVIGAGDFAVRHRGLPEIIGVLSAIERPTVVVPGNGETAEELAAACHVWKSAHVLHGTGLEIDGVSFFGIGGGIPVTPFGDWSYDFTEEQAEELLVDCPPGGVLVTHSPPHGAVDLTDGGTHFGSLTVRHTILAKKPRLVVCGHVHACWGQEDVVGDSPVVNAGPHGAERTL